MVGLAESLGGANAAEWVIVMAKDTLAVATKQCLATSVVASTVYMLSGCHATSSTHEQMCECVCKASASNLRELECL